MIDYAAIAANALAALQDAGQAMTLNVGAAASYNAATGVATASRADHACTGVLLPVGVMRGSGYHFMPDVLVRAEALAYIAAQDLAVLPSPGSKLTVQGQAWTVIGVDTLSPAGTPVLHALALTK
jgi:hypothetical protein